MHLTSIEESAKHSDIDSTSSSGGSRDDDESPERSFEAVLDKVEKALGTKQIKPEELFKAKTSSLKRPIVRCDTIKDRTKKEGMEVGASALKKESLNSPERALR